MDAVMFVRRVRSAEWVNWLHHCSFAGSIGLARLPGIWLNSLAGELTLIRASGVTSLVSLTEMRELRWAGPCNFGAAVARAELSWYHLPIRDFGIPGAAFEHAWRSAGAELRQRLVAGERLVIHCYAGLGRTGLMAARLLIEFGEPPQRAIGLVRAVRPGAIQTREQEAYLWGLSPIAGPAAASDREAGPLSG